MIKKSNDISFKTAAFVAAIGLLLMICFAIFADSLRTSIVVNDDVNATVSNLIANMTKFRFSILGYVIVILLDVLVAWALSIYFKPINKSLALLSGWFRLIYAIVFFIALFNLIAILQMKDMKDKPEQVMFLLQAFVNQWNFSFIFFGIHLGLIGFLCLNTKQIHSIFGILLLAGGFGYGIDGLGKVLIPNYSLPLIAFTFIGEVLLLFWLLIKGTKTEPTSKNTDDI